MSEMKPDVKRRGRPKREPVPDVQDSKYQKVCLIKSSAKKAMDPIRYDMIQHKTFMYLIEERDGQCLLCPGPSPASYLATWVPADCIKPYKEKPVESGQNGS